MNKSNKEEFNMKLENKGSQVRLLNEYITDRTPSIFISLDCGHIWKSTPRVVLKKILCLLLKYTKD